MALYDDNYVKPGDAYRQSPVAAPVPFMDTNIDYDIKYRDMSPTHQAAYGKDSTWYMILCFLGYTW